LLPQCLFKYKKEEALIIDATEQRKQRPIEKEKQKEYYSGKKKIIPLNQ